MHYKRDGGTLLKPKYSFWTEHTLFVQFQSLVVAILPKTVIVWLPKSVSIKHTWIQSVRRTLQYSKQRNHSPRINPETVIHISFKTFPNTLPRTLLLLPPLRLPPSGIKASPQLGPSSIFSWVKSVVAPSGLTRHKTGDGSCNWEIRVVLGILPFQCIKYQLGNLLSFTTTIPVLKCHWYWC